MASFTLTAANVFPPGTSVGAYQALSADPPQGAPVTPAVNSQTMGTSSLTFTGLTDGVRYWAYALVSGQHRYVSFTAGADADALDAGRFTDVTVTDDLTVTDTAAFAGPVEFDGVVDMSGASSVTYKAGSVGTSAIEDASVRYSDMAVGANGLAVGAFHAYRSAALTTALDADVVFDAESYDISGWHNPSTGVYTPQLRGLYSLRARVQLTTVLAADKYVSAYLCKNGTGIAYSAPMFQRGSVGLAAVVHFPPVDADGASDAFSVRITSDEAGTKGLQVGQPFYTWFGGEFVGRLA